MKRDPRARLLRDHAVTPRSRVGYDMDYGYMPTPDVQGRSLFLVLPLSVYVRGA